MPSDQVEAQRWVECRHGHGHPAEPRQAGEGRYPGHMKHRRRAEEDVVSRERARQDLVEGVGDEVPVRQHDTLRQTRCTPGVEQRGEIVPGEFTSADRCWGLPAQTVEQLLVLVGDGDHVFDQTRQCCGIAVGDQDSGTTVLHDLSQFGGRQPGVQRYQHEAGRGQPEEGLEVTMSVCGQQGDPIAPSHAQPGER